nr:MAG: RNA-dependent RNA polymerase [Riboviria sp.]
MELKDAAGLLREGIGELGDKGGCPALLNLVEVFSGRGHPEAIQGDIEFIQGRIDNERLSNGKEPQYHTERGFRSRGLPKPPYGCAEGAWVKCLKAARLIRDGARQQSATARSEETTPPRREDGPTKTRDQTVDNKTGDVSRVCWLVRKEICGYWPSVVEEALRRGTTYLEVVKNRVKTGFTKEDSQCAYRVTSLYHGWCTDPTCQYDSICSAISCVRTAEDLGELGSVGNKRRVQFVEPNWVPKSSSGSITVKSGRRSGKEALEMANRIGYYTGPNGIHAVANGGCGSQGDEITGPGVSNHTVDGPPRVDSDVPSENTGYAVDVEKPSHPVRGSRAEGLPTVGTTEKPAASLLLHKSNDTNPRRKARGSSNGKERKQTVGSVQLPKARDQKLVDVVNVPVTTKVTPAKVEDSRRGMQSGSRRQPAKGWREVVSSESIRTCPNLRVYSAKESLVSRIPRYVGNMEDKDAQKLPAQRGESGKGESAWVDAKHGRRRRRSARKPNTSDTGLYGPSNPHPRSSNPRKQLPAPKEGQAVQQGPSVPAGGTPKGKRLENQGVRESGKAQNRRERRRPKNDTSKVPEIQHRARPIHQSSRKEPVLSSGPTISKDGNPPKGNRQGNESVGKSKGNERNVGLVQNPKVDIVRPKSVGPTCGDTPVKSHAQVVQQPGNKQVVPVPALKAAGKQSNDGERTREVQRPRRGHEWRYDDRTGELCCSSCHTLNLSRFVKRACRRNRIRQYQRDVKKGSASLCGDETPAIQCPKYEPRVNEGIGKQSDLVQGVGRRRRPRNNDRTKVRPSDNSDELILLENGGTRTEDRGSGEGISPNRVLSDKTTQGGEQVGDDAGPEKSPGNVWNGVARKPSLPKTLLENCVASTSLSSPRTASLGEFLPFGSEGSQWPTVKQSAVRKERKRTGLQSKARDAKEGGDSGRRGSGAENAASACDNTGAEADVLGTMGLDSEPTSGDGENAFETAREHSDTSEESAGEDRERLEGILDLSQYPNIVERTGDIFAVSEPIIHCVGADFTCGKGFALEVRNRYKPNRRHLLIGKADIQELSGRTIVSLATKALSYRRPGPFCKYLDNLHSALNQAFEALSNQGKNVAAIPWLIGCGLDGQEPREVLNIVNQLAVKHKMIVTVWRSLEDGQYADQQQESGC